MVVAELVKGVADILRNFVVAEIQLGFGVVAPVLRADEEHR